MKKELFQNMPLKTIGECGFSLLLVAWITIRGMLFLGPGYAALASGSKTPNYGPGEHLLNVASVFALTLSLLCIYLGRSAEKYKVLPGGNDEFFDIP
jgi:hypothetical protein